MLSPIFSLLLLLLFLTPPTFSHPTTFYQYPPTLAGQLQPQIPESARQSNTTSIVRNVGVDVVPVGTVPKRYFGTITSTLPGIQSYVFKTGVEGTAFSLSFALPANTYDVELGFIQTQDCQIGSRIFNIFINSKLRESAFDIFRDAGCSKPFVTRYNRQIVDPVSSTGLTISFEVVSGVASLSFVRIRQSARPCVPEVPVPATTSFDHFAHSVPGIYPQGSDAAFVDRLGNGFYRVRVDGSGSHTHFTLGNYTARIKSYEWTREDTGKVISTSQAFWYKFPLGTTVLKLTVTDTVCSVDEDTTSITVTGNTQTGVICYQYADQGSILPVGSLKLSPRPTLSFISSSLNIRFPNNAFSDKIFDARCLFMINFATASTNAQVSVETLGSGIAHLYQGENRIFDTESATSTNVISTSVGFMMFEMTYRRTTVSKAPALVLKIDGTVPSKVGFDAAMTIPIISTVSPNSGLSAGGTEVRITGYNFYRPVSVFFGSTKATLKADPNPISTEVTVFAPPASGSNSVPVKLTTFKGSDSNEVIYSYSSSCDDVHFDDSYMETTTGTRVKVVTPTSMTVGHDGDLYVGTLEGQIQKITFDHVTHKVQTMCHSEIFQDARWKNKKGTIAPRVFLGIALDPRDVTPRPYVSVSTLFYYRREVSIAPSNLRAWSNGAIERFKPASAATKAKDPQQCLEHDSNIVDSLPVSNADHSVNQLLFTQTGDLIIAVGGNTNMGLPNSKLGSLWDSHFSAAILIARLSKSTFNGKIPYTTPENLRTARPTDGFTDVALYSTGFRNPFSMSMSRSGKIYVADMGPNKGFGDASASCDEYDEADAANLPSNGNVTGGGAVFGPGLFSESRPDKLALLQEGKFYGHPNLPRSAHLGTDECAYIDPTTNRTPNPGRKLPPSNYQASIALLTSPVTGVMEYGGNEFCGKLRGNMIFSYLRRNTLTAATQSNGDLSENAYQLSNLGGITTVEDSSGSVIIARFDNDNTAGFIVLKPTVNNLSGLYISGAVPFRHGRRGGTQLHIAGRGFTTSTSVQVGPNACQQVSSTANKIVCKVPAYTKGAYSVSVSVKEGVNTATLPNAVLYMQV